MEKKRLCWICLKKDHKGDPCALVEFLKKLDRPACGMYDCKLQHSFLLHVETGKSSNNCLSVVSAGMKCLFCGHLNEKSVVEAEDCCEYCGMTWMVQEDLQEAGEGDGKAGPLLSSSEAGSRIITVEPPRLVASGCAPRPVTIPEVTVPSELTMVEGCRAHVQYDTGSQSSLVTSAFVKSLGLTKYGEPCEKLISCGLTGQLLTAFKVHRLHFKVGMRVLTAIVYEVGHIGKLAPPQTSRSWRICSQRGHDVRLGADGPVVTEKWMCC